MARLLHPGVYENLLTSALEEAIEAQKKEDLRVNVGSADASIRSELLARHVYELLRRALEAVPGEDNAQTAGQVALVNRLVEILIEHGALPEERVTDTVQLLLEIAKHSGLGDTRVTNSTPNPLSPSDWSLGQWSARRSNCE